MNILHVDFFALILNIENRETIEARKIQISKYPNIHLAVERIPALQGVDYSSKYQDDHVN